MHIENAMTRQFGLTIPVIQAPMAGSGDTPELVAAVCNAGGIGFIGASYLSPEQIVAQLPYGIPEQLDAVLRLPSPEKNLREGSRGARRPFQDFRKGTCTLRKVFKKIERPRAEGIWPFRISGTRWCNPETAFRKF